MAFGHSPAAEGSRRRGTRLLVAGQCVRRNGQSRESVALCESASTHLEGAGRSNGPSHRADERRRFTENSRSGKESAGEQQGEPKHAKIGRECDVERPDNYALQI